MADQHGLSRRALMGGLAVGGAAAFGLHPGDARADTGLGTLRLANPVNPSSLDPHTGNSGSDHVALYPIYSTLVDWDYATLTAQPGLAQSWEFTDPQTLVLKLQKGVTFHDGTPFDADAVKYNIQRAKTMTRSTVKADVASVASVDTPDPGTVILHLSAPNTALPLILSDRAGMMVSPKAAEASPNGIDRAPVGAGAWKFVSWEDGARIVYAINPNFWKAGQPKTAGLNMAIIPELSTALRSVVAGENDLVFRLEPPQKAVIDRARSLVAVTGPTLYVNILYFNCGRGPLADRRVRQAMNLAVDKTAFNAATMLGLAEIAWSALPKEHWAYDPALENFYPHDVDKARGLLREAGFPDGVDITIGGYPDQTSQQRQEVLIDMFGKAGIRLKWSRGQVAEMSTRFFGKEQAFDALLSAWTGRPDPSLTYTLLFSKDGYYNPGHVMPAPELAAALAASQSTADLGQRRAALAKVQQIVVENALFLPLAFDVEIDAHSRKVTGYRPDLLGKPKFETVAVS